MGEWPTYDEANLSRCHVLRAWNASTGWPTTCFVSRRDCWLEVGSVSVVSMTWVFRHCRPRWTGPVAAEGIISGDMVLSAAVLDQFTPESPDDSSATVAGCIGLALGLLDEWLCGGESVAPAGLAMSVRLPPGHWTGERAAADVLTLARKGRAFRSLRTLIVNQGSHQLLPGTSLSRRPSRRGPM